MKVYNWIANSLTKIRKIYILLFIIWLLISRIVPFENWLSDTISFPVNDTIYNAFAIFGLFYLFLDFITKRYLFKSPYSIFLLLFMIICALSTLINREFGISNNLKTLVWTLIQFFVFFSFDMKRDRQAVKSEVRLFLNAFVLVNFVPVLFSLIQFMLNIGYTVPYQNYPRNQGFIENRLYGVFTDPNYAAVVAVLAIVFSVALIIYTKKWYIVAFHLTNILFQATYIVLTGSRTVIIVSLVMAFVSAFLYYYKQQYFAEKNKAYGILIPIAAGIMFCVMLTVVYPNLQKILSGMPSELNGQKIEISFERTEVDSSGDISNLRFDIWGTGLKVFRDKPLLGASPRNIQEYCKVAYPDSILVTSSRNYTNVHSTYVSLLASTGILGTLAAGAFAVLCLYNVLKFLLKRIDRHYFEILLGFLCVLAIAVEGVFYLDIVFTNLISCLVFWCAMGYILYFIQLNNAIIYENLSIEGVYKAIKAKLKKA